MKRILLILSLLTGTISLWSQDKIYENSSYGFDSQGKWSEFSEDYNALDRWIASNLKYPQEAINNKEHGTVVVAVDDGDADTGRDGELLWSVDSVYFKIR